MKKRGENVDKKRESTYKHLIENIVLTCDLSYNIHRNNNEDIRIVEYHM